MHNFENIQVSKVEIFQITMLTHLVLMMLMNMVTMPGVNQSVDIRIPIWIVDSRISIITGKIEASGSSGRCSS